MDLLGSILSSMDKNKPPTVGNAERTQIKKQKEEHAKRATQEKEQLAKLRQEVEDTINKFNQDSERQKHRFKPMNKVFRSITHDVADIAGLTAFSFGTDEVDRHVMIFKKEYAPSDDELLAYKRGEEWDPEKAKEAARIRELELEEEMLRKDSETAVNPLYNERKEKKQGKETAKSAEKIITPNRQFGFVSSENKRDQRSIEQTLADIRAKKKQKIADNGSASPKKEPEVDPDPQAS